SYKRLVEGAWAPTKVNWGVDNRTTALRVIPGSPKSTRLETRVNGSDTNAYLALAAALGSGLWGIERKLKLPAGPVSGSGYEDAGLAGAVFSGVWGNPVKSQVSAGVEAYRAHGADAIVAVGGGAAIDVAKAIALMVHHPGDLFDYEDEKPGARPIDQEIPTFMTVPTTAGTGSEVGRSTVISDDE